MNRSIQPELNSIDKINFVEPKRYEIVPGVYLFHMKNVPNETSKFDLYFDGGKCRGLNAVPALVNGLLLSGTSTKTSVEINAAINGLGGFYESGLAMESSVVSMYALKENLFTLFEIVHDAISNLSFDAKEIEQLTNERRQKLKISLQKVSVLAQRKFQSELFASDVHYKQLLEEEDLTDYDIDELKSFHKTAYLQGLNKIVVVGDIDENTIHAIIDRARSLTASTKKSFQSELQNNSGRFTEIKEDAMQSALRIGRILFNKKHDDYLDFLVLNTLLGDYFGSRLMSNIREDKGYTYGIGSMVAEYNNTGYFMIGTEVGKDVREQAISEIKSEITKLQNELVPEEELSLVQNYMMGQLLKSADGPYAMTDLFLSAEIHGKTLDFYNEAISHIKGISPMRIQELANKYLSWEDLTIVSAG